MPGLGNGDKLPFMIVANCLNGLYDEYDTPRAMAEEFLLLSDEGGIASWAPASYGFPTTNSLILRELNQALWIDRDLILGSAATTARIQAHLRRPDLPLSLFEIFTYFGDPAVQLSFSDTLALDGQDLPDPVLMGERLTYTLVYTVSQVNQSLGLTLSDALPQEVIYQSASPSPSSIDGQNLTWNLGNTPAGTYTATLTALVKISGQTHGHVLQNHAQLYDQTGGDQVLDINTTVHDVPITGLWVSNDGPTQLGESTTVSVGTTAGTNVAYNWELGDGHTAAGAHLSHTYPATGTYSVTVTATNGVGQSTASTIVTIVDWDHWLFLPLIF
jgi:hypothetical protein